MTSVLFSYLPAKLLFFWATWQSMFLFMRNALLAVEGTIDIYEMTFSSITTTCCALVILSKTRDASLARKLRVKATKAREKIFIERLAVTDIGWLVKYLLRLRTAGITVVFVMGMAVVAHSVTKFDEQRRAFDTDPRTDADSHETSDYATGRLTGAVFMGLGAVLEGDQAIDVSADSPETMVLMFLFAGIQSIILIPIVSVSLLARRVLGNHILGFVLSSIIMISTVAMWSWVSISDPFGLLVLAAIFILILPLGSIMIGGPIMAGGLLFNTCTLQKRIRRYPAMLANHISNIAYHGRLRILGEGLHQGSKPYSRYYSWRSKPIAVALLMISLLFLLAGFAQVVLMGAIHLIGSLLGLTYFWLADHVWEIARRLRLRPAKDILKLDPRRPVLILRSFTDDTLGMGGGVLLRKRMKILEVATKWCSLLGPVITFGRPGERFAALGPPRVYVEREVWRDAVTRYIEDARLVLVFVGLTASLDWEVKRALDLGCLNKIVFVVPPVKMSALGARWGKLKATISEYTFLGLAARDMPLEGIDPSAALLFWYREGTLHCLASRLRNRLAYEIAFKVLAEHLVQAEPDTSVEHDASRSSKAEGKNQAQIRAALASAQ